MTQAIILVKQRRRTNEEHELSARFVAVVASVAHRFWQTRLHVQGQQSANQTVNANLQPCSD